jgi:hypothetical protein
MQRLYVTTRAKKAIHKYGSTMQASLTEDRVNTRRHVDLIRSRRLLPGYQEVRSSTKRHSAANVFQVPLLAPTYQGFRR